MKKILALGLLGISIMSSNWLNVFAKPSNTLAISLYINNNKIATPAVSPVQQEGSILVPAREVFAPMGADVEWKSYENKIYIYYKDTLMVLEPEKKEAWVNGETLKMDVPAQIICQKVMLPIRFISETIGFDVKWVGHEQAIYIAEASTQLDTKSLFNNVQYSLEAKGTLVLQKPQGLTCQSLSIEDDYRDRKIIIDLKDNYQEHFGEGTYVINDKKIKNIEMITEETTKLIINEQAVQAFTIHEDNQNLYIDFVKPKEKYPQILFLDPGHGGSKPGTSANGLLEKEINLKQALAVKTLLEQTTDFKIYMSREEDSTHYEVNEEELRYRTALANEIEADLFVSMHNNSADSKVTGTEVFYYATDSTSKMMAELVHENIINTCQTKARKAKPDTGYVILNTSNMPAIIIETGFLTNPEEAMRLNSDVFNDSLAQAVSSAIKEVFNTTSF